MTGPGSPRSPRAKRCPRSLALQIVLGNSAGTVGAASASAREISEAVKKATRKAQRQLVSVTLTKKTGSLPHPCETKHCGARVRAVQHAWVQTTGTSRSGASGSTSPWCMPCCVRVRPPTPVYIPLPPRPVDRKSAACN